MKFDTVFDVFSRRKNESRPYQYSMTPTLRNKVLLYCHDVFGNKRSPYGGDDYTGEFWNEIHHRLAYRHGQPQLMRDRYVQSAREDAIGFLLGCNDDEFLDFIEDIFRVQCIFHVMTEENTIVAELNELFASENMGYEISEQVEERVVEPVKEYPFRGQEREVIKVVAYPTVIKKDDQVTHATIVRPALVLLTDPKYKTANQEYLEALEDYRKGDYGDCLTKCGSAFESVMKIICHTKRWPYKQDDTASTLVNTIIKNAGLESYFDQPLMLIATLRNRQSKSHGAGMRPKTADRNLAQFELNMTASAIVFMVNQTK